MINEEILVWSWILDKLSLLQRKKQKRKELSSESFKTLANEIWEITALSGRLCVDDRKFMERIERIQREMEQLDKLVGQKSFERLSPEKREELRRSLLFSKEELLRCLQSVPCPTDRKQ